MKRLLEFFQRTYRSSRTVVWECQPYLTGTYSFTSFSTILSTDLVDQAIMLISTENTRLLPLSKTALHNAIRITAVF